MVARTEGCSGCIGLLWGAVPRNGEGPHRALDVEGDDGAEVRHPCRAAFAIVYPECVLQCHFGA